jgi:hypothetical protein
MNESVSSTFFFFGAEFRVPDSESDIYSMPELSELSQSCHSLSQNVSDLFHSLSQNVSEFSV